MTGTFPLMFYHSPLGILKHYLSKGEKCWNRFVWTWIEESVVMGLVKIYFIINGHAFGRSWVCILMDFLQGTPHKVQCKKCNLTLMGTHLQIPTSSDWPWSMWPLTLTFVTFDRQADGRTWQTERETIKWKYNCTFPTEGRTILTVLSKRL